MRALICASRSSTVSCSVSCVSGGRGFLRTRNSERKAIRTRPGAPISLITGFTAASSPALPTPTAPRSRTLTTVGSCTTRSATSNTAPSERRPRFDTVPRSTACREPATRSPRRRPCASGARCCTCSVRCRSTSIRRRGPTKPSLRRTRCRVNGTVTSRDDWRGWTSAFERATRSCTATCDRGRVRLRSTTSSVGRARASRAERGCSMHGAMERARPSTRSTSSCPGRVSSSTACSSPSRTR